jgi:drug/metabolite transporter (DMT)-like permease
MWASTLLLLPFLLFFPLKQVPLLNDWLAVFALAILCTGIAYLIFFKLIEEVGVVGALSVTFLIPVFGVLWAYLFLGEVVGWSTLFGGVMVLLGTVFTNGVFDQVFNSFYSKMRKIFKGAQN